MKHYFIVVIIIFIIIVIRGESNIDHGYGERPLDVLGVGGQLMEVLFPISVAPIDELGEISLKNGHYQRGDGGSKNDSL